MDNRSVFWNGLGILVSGLAFFLPIAAIESLLIPSISERALSLGIPYAVNILRGTYPIFGIPALVITIYGMWVLSMTPATRREEHDKKVQDAENETIRRMMSNE